MRPTDEIDAGWEEPAATNLRVVEFRRRPSRDIVERLEKLLEAAKAGEIIGCATAWEYVEGGTGFWWEMEPGCRPVTLHGEVSVLSVRLANHIAQNLTGVPVEGDGR